MFSDEVIDLATKIISHCSKEGYKLALAESCTGGLISAALTEIPGSSAVVDRGCVTYSNGAKMDLLGVDRQTLAVEGAVSEDTAREMVTGILRTRGVEAAVAVTGIAGPGGGSKDKPVGRVHIAAARIGYDTVHKKCSFGDIGRSEVREATVVTALKMLNQIVRKR
jgi:nicotinamide-nucleotide amidase